jgi:two-component system alkaline phosphatase synthesis response regulator PhoP
MAARILLIEDDADLLKAMTVRLTASGYELLVARDGQDGLAKAQQERPDLILTDLMLPRLNGYEICAMLKQDVRYQKIPILIWSATKLQDQDAHLAEECGADAFILKTIDSKALLAQIEQLLASRRES